MDEAPCRVLVIDDNRDCADTTVVLLQKWGHDALPAYSAAEALEAAKKFYPDVILIDIGLPRRSGFDIADDLKKVCPRARFVALTGFTRADVVRRSKEQFHAHLTKPAEPSELRSTVRGECAEDPKDERG